MQEFRDQEKIRELLNDILTKRKSDFWFMVKG